jgi:histidinol-phosphate/aromatic aminotransferase/cobyric acid decarboxylase-like protein
MSKRTLGDKINRGFMIIVIVLGSIMLIRFAIAVVNYGGEEVVAYPETQDDYAETANALGIPIENVDSIVDSMYIQATILKDTATLRKIKEYYGK